MACFSEISLSQIEEFNRMDPEFYKQEYLEFTKKLNDCSGIRLSNISNITDGIHASPQVVTSGIQYISAKCVKDNEFITDNCIRISNSQNSKNPRTQLREGDVIITSVGTIGNAAVVESGLLPSNCDRHVGIVRIEKRESISPYYLSTFLNSKYGRFQTLREAAGNVQLNLYVRNIGFLIIPRLRDFEKEITDWTFQAYRLRDKSKALYLQAQELLEKKLGLDQLVTDKSVYSISTFANVSASHRLDAQHFQSKFTDLINHLSKFPCEKIKNIRSYNRRGVQPVYIENGFIDVVNSQHISKTHLKYDSFEKTSETIFNKSPEGHIRENDLLIYTTGAYIGQTNVFLQNTPALASNHVNILRIKPDIDSVYMGIVFQSKVGKYQTEMHSRGSAQAELYPSDIDKFVVPIITPELQKKIGDLVRNSLSAENESKILLEQAKKRVEELIEGVIEQ